MKVERRTYNPDIKIAKNKKPKLKIRSVKISRQGEHLKYNLNKPNFNLKQKQKRRECQATWLLKNWLSWKCRIYVRLPFSTSISWREDKNQSRTSSWAQKVDPGQLAQTPVQNKFQQARKKMIACKLN